jgi:CO/xanthine dehydrogenase Mo-binding subunit
VTPVAPEELRQHEVEGERLHRFELARRDFVKVLGGGLLVCLAAPRALRSQESGAAARRGGGEQDLPSDLAAWIHVGGDGIVTVFTGKVEMGQNIRTSLSQHVAEELHVPVASIRMVMGDTDKTPYDMGTFGSRTTPTMAVELRRAAATAREALLDLAATSWKADRGSLEARDGKVFRRDAPEKSAGYGELSRGQNLVASVRADTPLAAPADWKVAGRPAKKVEGRDFVTGKHAYTSDLAPAGVHYGKVLRPSGFRATLVSLDGSAAEKIPGARIVRDGDFVGVTAPDAWTAERALAALKAEWKSKVPEQISRAGLFEHLRKTARDSGQAAQVTGSVSDAMASAEVKLSQSYTVEYIAHAPLEPRAAVAEWKDGSLEVWTGTQRPFAVRDELAEAFRIPSGKVRVHVPDTGSAYGGKHQGDAAIEAARLARAAGRPVKLVWTREEEFTWAYFRPAGVIDVASGAQRDGKITAWEFHNFNSGPAAIATPYTIANQKIQFHPSDYPLRQGSYRGLAATANHFARETHMDELALALGLDPLELRRRNISNPRLQVVLDAAAERFVWNGSNRQKPAAGRGSGIAGGTEKGSYVATCAEVEVEEPSRLVRLRRIVVAFECGAVVNPDGLRNQVEGAIVQGIGGALFEAVDFGNGRIANPHFAQYRVPRFPDVPRIETVVLDRKDLPPAGAGETPLVALAPAIGNAIFAASGIRLRALPLAPAGLPL